jgi:hypothetical protein
MTQNTIGVAGSLAFPKAYVVLASAPLPLGTLEGASVHAQCLVILCGYTTALRVGAQCVYDLEDLNSIWVITVRSNIVCENCEFTSDDGQ